MSGPVVLVMFLVTWIGVAVAGRKTGWSVIVSIGGGFIASCILLIVVGVTETAIRGGDSDSYAGAISAANSNQPPVSLAKVASNCRVANADGSIVRFAKSAIPDTIDAESDRICAIASDVQSRYSSDARKGVDDVICGPTDRFVEKIGGGSYARAMQEVSSWNQDQQTEAVINAMNVCQSEQSRAKLARESTVTMNLYSIGTFHADGRVCAGVLTEIAPQSTIRSRGYELKGVAPCANFAVDMTLSNVFHPEVRPSGVPYGDVIVDTYKYNGDVPKKYVYKGSEHLFFTGNR
jgi:hypothetical protein